MSVSTIKTNTRGFRRDLRPPRPRGGGRHARRRKRRHRAARLRRLPVPMVFDHMAHVIEGHGTDGPGFAVLLELLREGIAWVKLSNALFAPAAERALHLARTNPDRMLWGTDWPHVAHSNAGVPDDAALVDALADWSADPALRERALVANPDRLCFRS